MKVLKKVDTSGWTYKFTCTSCDSELQAEKSDLTRNYYNGDFREPSYETFTCFCAVCKHIHTVPINNIPKALREELKRIQR